MEDIEQLNSMYEAHHPGIWTAVIESSPNEVQRLMNGNFKYTKADSFFIEYNSSIFISLGKSEY